MEHQDLSCVEMTNCIEPAVPYAYTILHDYGYKARINSGCAVDYSAYSLYVIRELKFVIACFLHEAQ